jgi:hypothetical protein
MTGQPRPPDGSLEAYVRDNRGAYTDEALYDALVRAGHPPEAARAALAAASGGDARPVAPRAVATILGLYVGTFALLSVGMLLNGRPRGYLMPDANSGILILAMSLAIAFGASLIWVASRRAFWIIVLLGIGLSFVTPGFRGLGPFLIAIPIGVLIWFVTRPKGFSLRAGTSLAVLLAVPVVLLLGVAGICLVSGLPLPGGPSE